MRPWTSAHPPWPSQPTPQPLIIPSLSNPPLCRTPGFRSVSNRSTLSSSHPVLSIPSRFPNTTRFGNRSPRIRMSASAHKSLLVPNFAVSMFSHRVTSRARLYEGIRWSGLLRSASMMRSKNPIKCHEVVLSLEPTIPPKRFDIPPPLTGGCSEGLDARSDFSWKTWWCTGMYALRKYSICICLVITYI